MKALEQSYLRTKATDYASYMRIAELKANSSNNTLFADSKGEIAASRCRLPRHAGGRWPRGADRWPDITHYYGTSGNSFVAGVEFGPKVCAVAISTGGASGDPQSPHFNGQALRYARGQLRPVYFYPSDLAGHVERSYHPGK